MSDNEIDLSGGGEPPQAEEEVEKVAVPPDVAAFRHVEPYPNECAYEAFRCLEEFRETFALVPKGSKYLPHLAKIASAAYNERGDILDELSRAHARGRCRSQEEIDFDAEVEAAAAEAEEAD